MDHDRLIAEIAGSGPIGFDRFMELALYQPDWGFYASGGFAGRRGDFITSVEVGPLFGAVMANALDQWWGDLSEPDNFYVIESGAGVGTLARSVATAKPRCLGALRYLMVERSDALRARQGDHLELTDPIEVAAAEAPCFASLAVLPAPGLEGVVIANELLDNLPTRIFERTASGWAEVMVGIGEMNELCECLVPRVPPGPMDTPVGGRIPIQDAAAEWLSAALGVLRRGRVVVFDYADETDSMAAREWRSWLRTYRAHSAGSSPLEDVGSQDITCEVALDQLRNVAAPIAERHQRDFLADHGIDALVDEGRRIWSQRAALGDLEAVRARSRVNEAAALTDESGLGGFTVLEWTVPIR